VFLFLFFLRVTTEITYTTYRSRLNGFTCGSEINALRDYIIWQSLNERKHEAGRKKRDYSVGDPGQFYCTPISPNPRRNLKIKMSEQEMRTYIMIYIYIYRTCRYGLRTCRFAHKTLALALRMMFYEHRGLNSLSPMSTVNISHR